MKISFMCKQLLEVYKHFDKDIDELQKELRMCQAQVVALRDALLFIRN